jgi:hypothetical protein
VVPRARSIASATSLGSGVAGVAQVEQHGGEALADLVVQLLGDALPLGLLGPQRPGRARGPLVLETLEHGVEAGDEPAGRAGAGLVEAGSGFAQVDAVHGAGQPVQRCQHGAQEEGVDDDGDGQADDEDHEF